MKKSRYLVTAAAALWMAIGLGMTAQAKSTYMLEIANQYDSEGTSRDDNDRNKVHPLEPDVYVEDASSDTIEMLSAVTWSKSPEDWTAGSEVTGTVYLGSSTGLNKGSLGIKVADGRNDAEITSVKKYTGSKYETDQDYVYTVRFTYQVAAMLGSTTWAGWDSANPSVASWNSVKSANTYRVVLYDDQGSVVSQIVEGATSYDFSPFMTKTGVQYYFEVTAIARNGNQRDYLEDGAPVSSLSSQAADPGITDGTWGDYQQGRRFTYKDGTVAAGKWERIMSKWYYFNTDGYAVTGWNEIEGKWYYMYEDGSMAAGTATPDGFAVGSDGVWTE